MKTKTTQKNIPDEWTEIVVSKVFSFLKTYAISRENLINGTSNEEGVGNIHYGDIHSTYGTPNIDLSNVSVPLVKDKDFSPKTEDLLRDGDLIMADVSEDYEGIGVTVSVHGLKNKKIVGGLHTFALRDTGKKTTERYRQYVFRNPITRNKLKKIANGVSVYGVSKTALSKLLLILPPLPEQNRIVAVLETWDKAIEKISRKIEIKKKIKKGLMWQLLAGKKRLKGFAEPWRSVKLNDIAKIYDGVHQTPTYVEKGIPFYSVEHITADDFKNTKYISEEHYLRDAKRVEIKKGDILMTRIGSIGGVKYVDWNAKAAFYVTLALLKTKDGCDARALSFFLQSKEFQGELWKKTLHVAFPNKINLGDIGRCKLLFPKNFTEQIAIADILTKANDEINALEKNLKIVEAQKRYLLNNLITGAIRTPESLKVEA